MRTKAEIADYLTDKMSSHGLLGEPGDMTFEDQLAYAETWMEFARDVVPEIHSWQTTDTPPGTTPAGHAEVPTAGQIERALTYGDGLLEAYREIPTGAFGAAHIQECLDRLREMRDADVLDACGLVAAYRAVWSCK